MLIIKRETVLGPVAITRPHAAAHTCAHAGGSPNTITVLASLPVDVIIPFPYFSKEK